MLRIKGNVNLEELEKFGFRTAGGVYQKDLEEEKSSSLITRIYMCIYLNRIDRIIRFSSHYCENETVKLDTLYDLIQAGLVEKVEAAYVCKK